MYSSQSTGLRLLAAATVLLLTTHSVADPPPCGTDNAITTICGFLAPEDIDVMASENKLVVGGFNLDNENGDIRVLDLVDHSVTTVYRPGMTINNSVPGDGWGDPNCPGPLATFAAHGIHLSRTETGGYRLLVVNHTGRESVEWLELKVSEDTVSATWRGCVLVDAPYWINDIAFLPQGGFVASHMMPVDIASSMFDRIPNDKIETGYIVEWQPDSGWRKIRGTDGALPNGILTSEDGEILYNNHYLGNQVIAVERATGKRLWQASVSGAPDNMSLAGDSRLLVTLHHASLRNIRDECMLKPVSFCGLPFGLVYIDRGTGLVTPVFESQGAPFGGSTVAVEHKGFIYMGAFVGDRIGRIRAPDL